MANDIGISGDWICDGKELKPKIGGNLSNTWVFNGKEIRPKMGAALRNTLV